MSSVSVYSSMPRTAFRGINDGSTVAIEMPVASYPIHLPLFVGLAPWGEDTKARYVNAGGLELLYGPEVTDPNSEFFTHQSQFLRSNLTAGAPAMFLRLVPEDARQASARFGIDIVADDLPEYERDLDGRFVLDNSGAKIPTGGTIQGYRVQIRKVEVSVNGAMESTFGLAGMSEGNLISDRDGSTSSFYPFMDAMARFKGARGNNLGIRFIAPTTSSVEPADENMAARVGSFLYRIQQVQRSNSSSTPAVVPSVDGRTYLDISFKAGAKDVQTNTMYDARKVIINGFEGKTPETFRRWGNMERIHVYGNHLKTVLDMLAAAESTVTGNQVNPDMINFLTGADVNGIPYHSFVVEGPAEGGLLMTENSSHYFVGGADGTLGNDALNTMVLDMMENLQTYKVPLHDIAAYPFSSFWDSGFPLDVKLSLAALHNLRPDVMVATCPQDVTERLNTPAQDSSIAIALRSRFRAQTESTEFGTKACRFFCQANAGYLVGSDYDGLVPFLEDTMIKVAEYMGAGNGIMNSSNAFGRGSQNVISRYRDHNAVSRDETARNSDWSNGLTYAESFDIDRLFVAGYQSMYETQNSVLHSLINVLIINNITRLGHIVWRNWSGDSQLTDEEFFAAVEQNMIDLTEDRYDNRAKVIPRAYKTQLDNDLGFSYHLDVDAGFEVMRTVQHLAIIARRRRDME